MARINCEARAGKEAAALSALNRLSFEAHRDQITVAIRSARPDDAGDIESGYRGIQIVPTCAADLTLFQNRGGMFQIPSGPEILADCMGGSRRFIVAREADGSLCAMMRLGTDTSEYEGLVETRETLMSYIELVIRCQHERFAYPFLCACFKGLIRAGYRDMVFQIYHLLSWESENGTERLGLANHASLALHQKLGAVRAGALPGKTLAYVNGRLCIRPDVYHMELHHAVEKLEGLSRDANWRVSD